MAGRKGRPGEFFCLGRGRRHNTQVIKSIQNSLNLQGKANIKLLLRVIKSTSGGTADHALEVFFLLFSLFVFFNINFHLPGDFACDQSIFPF